MGLCEKDEHAFVFVKAWILFSATKELEKREKEKTDSWANERIVLAAERRERERDALVSFLAKFERSRIRAKNGECVKSQTNSQYEATISSVSNRMYTGIIKASFLCYLFRMSGRNDSQTGWPSCVSCKTCSSMNAFQLLCKFLSCTECLLLKFAASCSTERNRTEQNSRAETVSNWMVIAEKISSRKSAWT